jgi:hypothetical protein
MCESDQWEESELAWWCGTGTRTVGVAQGPTLALLVRRRCSETALTGFNACDGILLLLPGPSSVTKLDRQCHISAPNCGSQRFLATKRTFTPDM